MTVDPETILLVLVSGALLGGVITGLAGFGSGPVVMGLWLLVLEPKVAAPLLMLSGLIYLPLSMRTIWNAIEWRRVLPFVAGAAVGVPAGIQVLQVISPESIKLTIGIFLSLYGPLRLILRNPPAIRPATPVPDSIVGVIGGFVGGAAAIPGIVWSLWCSLRGWTKDQQRAVYQPLNLIVVIFALSALAWEGLVTRQVTTYAAWCIPAALVGVAIGTRLYRRVGELDFKKIVLLILTASGLILIINVLARS